MFRRVILTEVQAVYSSMKCAIPLQVSAIGQVSLQGSINKTTVLSLSMQFANCTIVRMEVLSIAVAGNAESWIWRSTIKLCTADFAMKSYLQKVSGI